MKANPDAMLNNEGANAISRARSCGYVSTEKRIDVGTWGIMAALAWAIMRRLPAKPASRSSPSSGDSAVRLLRHGSRDEICRQPVAYRDHEQQTARTRAQTSIRPDAIRRRRCLSKVRVTATKSWRPLRYRGSCFHARTARRNARGPDHNNAANGDETAGTRVDHLNPSAAKKPA